MNEYGCIIRNQRFGFHSGKEPNDFLGAAQRKTWNQYMPLSLQHGFYRFGQSFVRCVISVSNGGLVSAMSGFNDQAVRACSFRQRTA